MSDDGTPTDGRRRRPGTPQCLKVVGAPSAYTALMASRKGLGCVYLSGGGVALDGLGVPDLGVTTLQDVLEVSGELRGEPGRRRRGPNGWANGGVQLRLA